MTYMTIRDSPIRKPVDNGRTPRVCNVPGGGQWGAEAGSGVALAPDLPQNPRAHGHRSWA
jgi:hypothetical protein